MEGYALGAAGSDSEEDEFDKGRQHSVLPHKAGEHPFYSQILQSGDLSLSFFVLLPCSRGGLSMKYEAVC